MSNDRHEWATGTSADFTKLDADLIAQHLIILAESNGGQIHLQQIIESAIDPKSPLYALPPSTAQDWQTLIANLRLVRTIDK